MRRVLGLDGKIGSAHIKHSFVLCVEHKAKRNETKEKIYYSLSVSYVHDVAVCLCIVTFSVFSAFVFGQASRIRELPKEHIHERYSCVVSCWPSAQNPHTHTHETCESCEPHAIDHCIIKTMPRIMSIKHRHIYIIYMNIYALHA